MLRGLRHSGLHQGAVIALRLLAENDGMSQRDLAEVLHLSRPRITGILQSLEKAGAVRRLPDAADQRVTRVYLTPEGRRQEQEHRAAFEDYVNSTVGALGEQEKRELARLLSLLAERIEHRVRIDWEPEAAEQQVSGQQTEPAP
jgi:DNA-binding MarR family transcriptional regulator